MSDRPTIEDAVDAGIMAHTVDKPSGRIVTALAVAAADGPIRSASGTLIVHRAEPELAARLNEWADLRRVDVAESGLGDDLRRAVRLLAGDPEEES